MMNHQRLLPLYKRCKRGFGQFLARTLGKLWIWRSGQGHDKPEPQRCDSVHHSVSVSKNITTYAGSGSVSA